MSPTRTARGPISAAIAVLGLLLAVPPSWAGGSPRAHDGGFFLRLSAGGGGAQSQIDLGGTDVEIEGFAGDVNFAIGAVVANNWAVHGTLLGWDIGDPEVKLGGSSFVAPENLTLSALGAGVTYYAMPANIYFSPTIGLGWLSIEDAETDAGLVLDFTIGKEWWVGGSWGLGLNGYFGYHSIPDGGIDENWSGVSYGLRFSATMN
jgi:hypothetical protein